MTIAMTVSSIVTRRPSRIELDVKYWPTMSHSKRGFVAIDRTSAIPNSATMAAAIQRPGCRTGTALMSSGRPAGGPGCVTSGNATYVGSARRPVDHRVRDRTGLDAPLREDRLVLAARDQLLHRGLDGLLHSALLRYRYAVRRLSVWLAHDLELAARLLDDVGGHGRVGHAHLCATARQRQVGPVLVGIHLHRDGRLAARLALLRLGRGVVRLRRALLGRDLVAAQVGERVDCRAALRLGVERGAGVEVRHEVDRRLAFLRVGERGHAEVVLPGCETRDDAVERRVLDLRLQAHDAGERLREVGVHTHDGLVARVQELVRR